jgi:hypothetical protein
MKKKLVAGIALVVSMLFSGIQGMAGVITFEDMPQSYWYNGGQQNFGNYWQGVNFGPASTILEDQVYGYNSSYYPPHSGHAVLFSITVPSIKAVFDSPVDSVSLWYTSYSDFYLDAYDTNDILVGQIMGASNLGTNNYLEVNTGDNNIAYVIMHDSGNYFTVDDFSASVLTGAPSPEPSAIVLLGIGLGMFRRGFLRKVA